MMYIIDKKTRDQAFYLIKKYTSYRHLDFIYKLEKEFVDAFEQQLRHPPLKLQNEPAVFRKSHEEELLYYLNDLNYEEKGLKELTINSFKKEAYELFFQGDIQGRIFGRYGDEHGLVNDVFYQNLGLGEYYPSLDEDHDHSKYILKLLIARDMAFGTTNTLFSGEYVIPDEDKIYDKWSYESLFTKPNWPLCKQIFEPMIPCPKYNENEQGQIISGQEVQVSGVYEPWFDQPIYQKLTSDHQYNPYVGCPNYFLDGFKATQYKLEGTDDWYDVKWRLIWEDTRYLDGRISEEEKAYVFDVDNIGNPTTQVETITTEEKLSVLAGKVCPKTGYWITIVKENSRQYIKQGDILPNVESDWGDIYWHFDGEK